MCPIKFERRRARISMRSAKFTIRFTRLPSAAKRIPAGCGGGYPVRATAEAALERGDLFIEESDGQPVGTAIINRIQVDVYRNAEWQYPAPDDQIMVLHTLVIDPRAKGRGLGRAFVDYYEQTARDCGCRYLRMDTNALNANARAFYRKLNYREIGIQPCDFNGISNIQLVLLEKCL